MLLFANIQYDTLNLADVSRIARKGCSIYVYFLSRKESESYRFDSVENAEDAHLKIMNDMRSLKAMH